MPYAPFFQYFPDIARMETRAISVPEGSPSGLPADDYGFVELYCDEPGCDCRRVFFNVMSNSAGKDLAVIAWGWESREFYKRWLGSNDRRVIDELKGPSLNIGSPQSRLAPILLELVKDVLLEDDEYVERIKRHYRMFREKVDITPEGIETFAEKKSTLQFTASGTEKINSYKFHQIVSVMKKEFGSIRKGDESDFLFDLLPMEEAIIKFSSNPAHKSITDMRVMEAIKLCLFRIRGYLAGVSYDFGKLVEPVSIELADYLSKTFDPYAVEEIRVIAEEQYGINESGGLRRFFEIPVKCLLRIYDSVENRSKMGVRGYLEFIIDSIGHKIDLDEERVRIYIRGTG
ncbi:MAG: hypothetical protein AB2L14_10235 [Candidatus Xenobiia bacterium LiM19]